MTDVDELDELVNRAAYLERRAKLDHYRRQGPAGERFASFVERLDQAVDRDEVASISEAFLNGQ